MSSKTHQSIGVHTTVLKRLRLSILKRSKSIKLNVVKQVNYAHATDTHACDILSHRFHFDASVDTHTICMRIRFVRCVFGENAQRISVEGTPKRIEMYAFSSENALKRTKPQSYELVKVVLTKKAWRLHHVSLETCKVIVSVITALVSISCKNRSLSYLAYTNEVDSKGLKFSR